MLKRRPFYAILFSIFPVLSLTAHNIREIAPGDFIRPLLASAFLGFFALFCAWLVLRDWHRASLLTLLFLVLFFTYGHIYNALEDATVGDISIFRHRSLAPLWGLILLGGGYWLGRKVKRPEHPAYWLNLLSIFMLVYPVFTISSEIVKQTLANREIRRRQAEAVGESYNRRPDIYYIILDSYGRADVLRDLGHDNTEFLNALRQRGFYIADCSQANYPYTRYSLTSALNHDYLDAIGATDYNTLIRLLNHGSVRSFMEGQGYQVVSFSTGNPWDEWRDADIFLDINVSATTLTDFERLMADSTLARAWLDYAQIASSSASTDIKTGDLRRQRVYNTLSNLVTLPNIEGDLFVFAHVNVPHQPYLFGPDGELINVDPNSPNREEITHAYLGQVKFINREILRVVDAILANSEPAPIIVIQGDHGPQEEISLGYERRMPILNAYFLPGLEAGEALYPSISPVNTFRIILNAYFEQDLPLLEDRSYFSPSPKEKNFKLVPNSCPGKP